MIITTIADSSSLVAGYAANDLALKLKLEQRLTTRLNQYFNTLAQQSYVHYSKTGQVLSLVSYNKELEAILREHYRVVAKKFSKRIDLTALKPKKTQKAADDPNEDENNTDKYLAALLLIYLNSQHRVANYIDERAYQQAALINDTTYRHIQATISQAILAAAVAGVILSQADIAKVIQDAIKQAKDERVETIALTETQNLAETAKTVEAQEADTVLSQYGFYEDWELFKKWSTIMDGKNRASHGLANGQTVPAKEKFVVDGEELEYPGDTRTASPKNYINCRCSVVYILVPRRRSDVS